jgi:hypothetical protein
MATQRKSLATSLVVWPVIYLVASLVHFVQNAQFRPNCPNLPASWTRTGVYYAWLGMTTVGMCGYVLGRPGHLRVGLIFLMIYCLLGLESLGHYVFAPMVDHTWAMNFSARFNGHPAG